MKMIQCSTEWMAEDNRLRGSQVVIGSHPSSGLDPLDRQYKESPT